MTWARTPADANIPATTKIERRNRRGIITVYTRLTRRGLLEFRNHKRPRTLRHPVPRHLGFCDVYGQVVFSFGRFLVPIRAYLRVIDNRASAVGGRTRITRARALQLDLDDANPPVRP